MSYHVDPEHYPPVAHGNHGKTPAAWATNGLIVLGALIAAIGFMIPEMIWIWIGAGVVVVAFITGAVMRAMGLGQRRSPN